MNNKKISVLIIATTKLELDGITNVILNYYRSMDKSNMKIDFVTPNELREDLSEEFKTYGSKVFKITGRTRNPIKYIKILSNIIKENKYNIVHAHGNSYTLAIEMYAAKLGGCKIRIPHSHNTTSKHMLVHNVLKGLFNKNYTHGFACGQKAGEWLYNTKKFEIINNGINIDNYKYKDEVREQYRKKYKLENNKVIGHIGRFNDQKNHQFLIKVFKELYKLDNNYRLMLIGDGILRKNIENQVKELGLTEVVVFIGKTLDVPNLMQAMDMIIMPSKYEGLPLTLVEAQAACLPCFISTAISEEVKITDLIKFISLEKEAKEWADEIYKYEIKDRNKLKIENYNNIIESGYSIETNAKKLKSLYQEYIKLEYSTNK